MLLFDFFSDFWFGCERVDECVCVEILEKCMFLCCKSLPTWVEHPCVKVWRMCENICV